MMGCLYASGQLPPAPWMIAGLVGFGIYALLADRNAGRGLGLCSVSLGLAAVAGAGAALGRAF